MFAWHQQRCSHPNTRCPPSAVKYFTLKYHQIIALHNQNLHILWLCRLMVTHGNCLYNDAYCDTDHRDQLCSVASSCSPVLLRVSTVIITSYVFPYWCAGTSKILISGPLAQRSHCQSQWSHFFDLGSRVSFALDCFPSSVSLNTHLCLFSSFLSPLSPCHPSSLLSSPHSMIADQYISTCSWRVQQDSSQHPVLLVRPC